MMYDPDALLTLKQQLTDIIESCRKFAPSDEGLFIQRQTKQKDTNKKLVHVNLPIPKKKERKGNKNLPEEWVDQQTMRRNSVR